jgi:hypothetical protein
LFEKITLTYGSSIRNLPHFLVLDKHSLAGQSLLKPKARKRSSRDRKIARKPGVERARLSVLHRSHENLAQSELEALVSQEFLNGLRSRSR